MVVSGQAVDSWRLPPMLAADPTLTLAILRQNLHVVRLIHASALRKRNHRLATSEAERIAWIERQIADLEAEICQGLGLASAE